MENNFNDYENKFLEDLKIIDSYIPAGYELEIDRWCGDDDFIVLHLDLSDILCGLHHLIGDRKASVFFIRIR